MLNLIPLEVKYMQVFVQGFDRKIGKETEERVDNDLISSHHLCVNVSVQKNECFVFVPDRTGSRAMNFSYKVNKPIQIDDE